MIDLHVHSNVSDGSDTPTMIIEKAKALKLNVIALTDHDSIDGLQEAERAAIALKVRFIKGIELTVDYDNNRLLHLLGLDIDPVNPRFLEIYNAYRTKRASQLEYVMTALRKRGVKLNLEDLAPYVTGGKGDRQAIAKWLVASGHTKNITHSWMDYLDLIPHAEGEILELSQAFEMIKAAGGKTFLAHYCKGIGLEGYDADETVDRLIQLKEQGLDGIERFYPTYTQEQEQELESMIQSVGLLTCGGSDYHGTNRPSIGLGIGSGDFYVPDDCIKPWYK